MEPFIAEIRMVAFGFPPRGWAFCDGQLIAISQNSALFSILGTTYGGDGRTTFGLPDLRGRTPIQQGSGPGLSTYRLGQKGGSENVTLTANQTPSHTHGMQGNNADATGGDPAGNLPAAVSKPAYANAGAMAAMNAAAVTNSGGSQHHTNTQPTLAVYFCIALVGIFPS